MADGNMAMANILAALVGGLRKKKKNLNRSRYCNHFSEFLFTSQTTHILMMGIILVQVNNDF